MLDVKSSKDKLVPASCPNADDKYPEIDAGTITDGYPTISIGLKDKLALVTKAVQFETDSDQLKASSEEPLMELMTTLHTYEYYYLKTEGHTDSQACTTNNLILSQQRARTYYDFLVQQGVAAERLQHVG